MTRDLYNACSSFTLSLTVTSSWKPSLALQARLPAITTWMRVSTKLFLLFFQDLFLPIACQLHGGRSHGCPGHPFVPASSNAQDRRDIWQIFVDSLTD